MPLFSCFIFLFFSFLSTVYGQQSDQSKQQLNKSNQAIQETGLKIAQIYYSLDGQSFKDITEEILNNPTTTEAQKANLLHYHRRIIAFNYPSDGLKVKGFISFTPEAQFNPLLIYVRGGNREFGLENPAIDLLSYRNYTTISTTYRDGVSEGQDQFGGNDVDDVNNLIRFIPILEKHFNLNLHQHCVYLLGASRGGLEMFLALARFPDIQNQVDKVVSLSGILDLHNMIQERADMKEMFEKDFGFNLHNQGEKWINQREPILAAEKIRKDLPILIIQGTQDNRVNLEAGKHMFEQLHQQGNQVAYWEIKGGQHTLPNIPNRMEMITSWLETGHHSTC